MISHKSQASSSRQANPPDRDILEQTTSKIESMSAKVVTEQIDVVSSQLSETSNHSSCANLNPLVDQWASLEEPTIHKIPLTLESKNGYDLAVIDSAEESVFLYSEKTGTITVYTLDGGSRKNKTKVDYVVRGMCLVNDEFVLLQEFTTVIEVRDKKTLRPMRKVDVRPRMDKFAQEQSSLDLFLLHLNMDNTSQGGLTCIDGYADKLAVASFTTIRNDDMARLCLFRGTNFEIFATETAMTYFDLLAIAFCNEESILMLVDGCKLYIFNFNQQKITTTRIIKLDVVDIDAHRFSYLTNPAWPRHQGFLVLTRSGTLLCCKFDERSLKSCDKVPTFVLKAFSEHDYFIASSSNTSKALVRRFYSPYEYYVLSLS